MACAQSILRSLASARPLKYLKGPPLKPGLAPGDKSPSAPTRSCWLQAVNARHPETHATPWHRPPTCGTHRLDHRVQACGWVRGKHAGVALCGHPLYAGTAGPLHHRAPRSGVRASMVATAFDASLANQQVLALDERTPNLRGLLAQIAPTLGVKAPRRHLPLGLLRGLLKIPGVAMRLGTNTESLSFIRTERFDMAQSTELESRCPLAHPDMQVVLERAARFVRRELLN